MNTLVRKLFSLNRSDNALFGMKGFPDGFAAIAICTCLEENWVLIMIGNISNIFFYLYVRSCWLMQFPHSGIDNENVVLDHFVFFLSIFVILPADLRYSTFCRCNDILNFKMAHVNLKYRSINQSINQSISFTLNPAHIMFDRGNLVS